MVATFMEMCAPTSRLYAAQQGVITVINIFQLSWWHVSVSALEKAV